MKKNKEEKAETPQEEKEKPVKAEKSKRKKGKGLTSERLSKIGKREMRLSTKFGKLLMDETDEKRSALLKDAKSGLDQAAAAILLLSK